MIDVLLRNKNAYMNFSLYLLSNEIEFQKHFEFYSTNEHKGLLPVADQATRSNLGN